MFKRLIHKAQHEQVVMSPGTLRGTALAPKLTGHQGIPGTASILAYDPVQNLLAMGTRDGRIKVIGQEGVQACFISPFKAPCKYLEFIINAGCLVQATTRGDVEVWDLRTQLRAASICWPCEITALVVAQGTPYIYLGDSSGVLNVLQFVDGYMSVLPYNVPPEVTQAGLVKPNAEVPPKLVAILPQPHGYYARLVLAFSNGILVLWDLHELRVLATRGGTELQRARLAEAGDLLADLRHGKAGLAKAAEPLDEDEEDREIKSLCWACANGSIVAAGYTDGDVALWAFPTANEIRPKGYTAAMAEFSGVPLKKIQLETTGKKVPVTVVKWCSTGDARAIGGGRLYMFGGGRVANPETVSVVTLTPGTTGKPRKELSWFGPVADILMVSTAETIFKATAVFVLTIPGQLHVWDEALIGKIFETVAEGQPTRDLPTPTSVEFALGDSAVTAAKLVALREYPTLSELLLKLPEAEKWTAPLLPSGAPWPISGGLPADIPNPLAPNSVTSPCIYLTGHHSGLVHLWEASTPKLTRLATATPSDKIFVPTDGQGFHSVTALNFCPVAGLLVVGYDNGMVRLLVLSSKTRSVWRHTLNPDRDNQAHVDHMENVAPGFQCVAVLSLHKAKITTIAIASGPGKVAIGDNKGLVTVFCLRRFNLVFHGAIMPGVIEPLIGLEFAMLPSSMLALATPGSPQVKAVRVGTDPTGKAIPRSASLVLPPPTPAATLDLVLYAAVRNSAITLLEASKGILLGAGPLSTKHASKAISLHLMDSTGTVHEPLAGQLDFPWAFVEPLSSLDPDSTPSERSAMIKGASDVTRPMGLSGWSVSDDSANGFEDEGSTPSGASTSDFSADAESKLVENEPDDNSSGRGGSDHRRARSVDCFVDARETLSTSVMRSPSFTVHQKGLSSLTVTASESTASARPCATEELRISGQSTDDFSFASEPSDTAPGAATSAGTPPEEASPRILSSPRSASGRMPVLSPSKLLRPILSVEINDTSHDRIEKEVCFRLPASPSQSRSPHSSPFRPGASLNRLKPVSPHRSSNEANTLPPPHHSPANREPGAPWQREVSLQTPKTHNMHSAFGKLVKSKSAIHRAGEQGEGGWGRGGGGDSNLLAILVAEDCVRIYSTSVIFQAERISLKKVKIFESGTCVWASTFGIPGEVPSGLLLMSSKGEMSVRALPDLAPVKNSTLSEFLGWNYEWSSTVEQTACARDGRLALLTMETELALVSMVEDPRADRCRPSLYSDEVASTAHSAEQIVSSSPKEQQQANVPDAELRSPPSKLWGNLRSALRGAEGQSAEGKHQWLRSGGTPSYSTAQTPGRKQLPTAKDLPALFSKNPDYENLRAPIAEEAPELEEETARKKAAALLGLDFSEDGELGDVVKPLPGGVILEGNSLDSLAEDEEEGGFRKMPGLFVKKVFDKRKKDEERRKAGREDGMARPRATG